MLWVWVRSGWDKLRTEQNRTGEFFSQPGGRRRIKEVVMVGKQLILQLLPLTSFLSDLLLCSCQPGASQCPVQSAQMAFVSKKNKACAPKWCIHPQHTETWGSSCCSKDFKVIECVPPRRQGPAQVLRFFIFTPQTGLLSPYCHFQLIPCIFMCQLCKSQDKNALSTHDLDWLSLLGV